MHLVIAALSAALIATVDARAQGVGRAGDPAGRSGGATRPLSATETRNFVSCKTLMTYSQSHGTQVEYIRPDGANFLWYPGNTVIVPGRWTVMAAERARICFRYGPATYNPVTREAGGRWSCRPADGLAATVVDSAEGDVFKLAGRTAAPLPLSRERTTIAALQKKVSMVRSTEQQPRRTADAGCGLVAFEIRLHPLQHAAGPLRLIVATTR